MDAFRILVVDDEPSQIDCADCLQQFQARHVGHFLVGENQVDRLGAKHFQRLRTAFREQRLEAALF